MRGFYEEGFGFNFSSVTVAVLLIGRQWQSDRVSYNLSLEADSFNATRQLTVINTRAENGFGLILFVLVRTGTY